MVDIETTGTDPQFGGILQISAIKFNLETGETDSAVFDACPTSVPNRFWSEGTRNFWSQRQKVYTGLVARQEPYMKVFQDFADWGARDGALRFWSKPLSFDWPFLASHFGQLGLEMPFHYRYARDVNTYIAACKDRGAEHVDMMWVPSAGQAHNALADCVTQIRQVLAARRGQFYEVVEGEVVE
jgi:oligoribonuclease (3'-5' exoribonuclease)